LLRYLIEGGFDGDVHPVNPNRETVQGLPAVPTVLDLQAGCDVALLAIPANLVLGAIEQCAEAGVKAAVVLSAGFSEVGEDGARAQDEILAAAHAGGIRLLGPNCLGVLNSATGYYGTFANALSRGFPEPGPVAICSQSGAYGAHLLYLARRRGMGVTYWITTGNEGDVDVADAIAWMALRPEVTVVAAYLEGVRDGERFMQALQLAAETNTAVIVTKVGSSSAGAEAASSHTAALAGSDEAYEAAFTHFGVLRARGTEDLLDIAYVCARAKPMAGNRLGIVTVSGGAGVQACDAAARHGLEVPSLPAEAQDELRSLLPYAGVRNPIDVTAQALQRMDLLSTALKLVVGSPTFDGLLVFFTTSLLMAAFTEPLTQAIGEGAANRCDEPVALCMIADDVVVRDFEARGFLVFEDIDRAVAALGALAQLGRFRERMAQGMPEAVPEPGAPLPSRRMSEHEAKGRLAAAGVPMLPELVAETADDAVASAEELGYPVALKILSADIPHKSEMGAVALGLSDSEAVRSAAARVLAAASRHAPGAQVQGLLVSPMAPDGVEMIAGVHRDPTFGLIIMVGLGGIFVEVFQDVSFRLIPVTEPEVIEMINELRGAALLRGSRGRPMADLDAFARAVAAISRFALAQGERLHSLDINPLLVLPEGAGVLALDAVLTPVGTPPVSTGSGF
jgi:acyl-CoA synthetase (NDP forming)